MKKNFRAYLAIFVVMTFSGAALADETEMAQQIDALNKRVTELEKRLDALASPAVQEMIEQVSEPSNPGHSDDLSNWNRLKVGYGYGEVEELLGKPVKIKKGAMEFWYYSERQLDGPFVKFLFKQVASWSGPEAE